jgi:hypothetical protein
VITTAPPGAWVSVRNCAGSWCNVNYRGIDGWMSAGYIGGGPQYYGPRPYYAPPPPPAYYYPRPYPYYRPYGGPRYGFSFGFGGRL